MFTWRVGNASLRTWANVRTAVRNRAWALSILSLLVIRLGHAPIACFRVGVFIPMDDEPTEGGPLGQQPLYRRRIGSLQFRPDPSSSCLIASWRRTFFPADFRMMFRRSHSADEPQIFRQSGPPIRIGKQRQYLRETAPVSRLRPVRQVLRVSSPEAGGFRLEMVGGSRGLGGNLTHRRFLRHWPLCL